MVSGRDPATGLALNVTIDAGRISAVEPGDEADSAWLSPGLIDLQVNGFAGHDLNAEDLAPETVITLCQRLRRQGVTTFLPTLISASEEALIANLCVIAEARRVDQIVANAIPSVHVEGPHVSSEDGPRGAHPSSAIRPPDIAEFDRWQHACGGLIGMVTLSPHYEGSVAYIRKLRQRNVLVALGHTHATPAQITVAVEAGATLSTHLGNGVAANLPRHPNLIWTQLADDRLTATLIADGHHLSADVLKTMIRAKGVDRCVLVSDLTAIGGMPPGIYDQPIGGRVELTTTGRLQIPGTPYLAGAAQTLIENVSQVIAMVGLSLSDALALATTNPGRILGREVALEVGARADLIRFYWSPDAPTIKLDTIFAAGTLV